MENGDQQPRLVPPSPTPPQLVGDTRLLTSSGRVPLGRSYLNPAHLAGKVVENAQNLGFAPGTFAAVDHFL
jgi:hypothetical protein